MAISKFNLPVYKFGGCKNTELSPMAGQGDTARVLYNWDVLQDASIERRQGIAPEENYVYAKTLSLADLVRAGFTYYVWNSPNNLAKVKFLVVQVNSDLLIFNMGADIISASLITTIDMLPYIRLKAESNAPMDYAAGKGALFIVSKAMDPCYIEYDETTSTFEVTSYKIEIRDFKGLESGYADTYEPPFPPAGGKLNNAHHYNLKNSGWPREFSDLNYGLGGTAVDLVHWAPLAVPLAGATFPSLSEQPYMYILEQANQPQFVGMTFLAGRYQRKGKDSLNIARSPMGNFILDAFVNDRDKAFADAGYPATCPALTGAGQTTAWLNYRGFNTDAEDYNQRYRPTKVMFMAGRVFYTAAPNKQSCGNIYFSRILVKLNEAGQCYQRQNPTAPEINKLSTADGGVVSIPESGSISDFAVVGEGIIVTASNGIWGITGGSDSGFAADKYRVYKIADGEFLSQNGIVKGLTTPLIAGNRGIFAGSEDNISSKTVLANITLSTINADYIAIPADARENIVTCYDWAQDRIFFLYNRLGELYTRDEPLFKITAALVYSIQHKGFYDYYFEEPATNGSFVGGMFNGPDHKELFYTETVTVNGVDVTVGTDPVISNGSVTVPVPSAIRLLLWADRGDGTYSLTIGQFSDRAYRDWYAFAGTNEYYDSKAVTTWDITVGIASTGGPIKMANRRKQSPYVITHMEQTETAFVGDEISGYTFDYPSACSMRFMWGFSDDATSNRWSDYANIYRLRPLYLPSGAGAFTYPYEIITCKSRVRGHGQSLSIEFLANEGNSAHIYGWEVEQSVTEG